MSGPYTEALIGADFVLPPFNHQLEEFETNVEEPARALAWTMRTGKSKAAIDKACHLYKRGLIDGVMIFAPNGVHANWIDRELPTHVWPGIPTAAVVWRSKVGGSKAVKRIRKAERGAWEAERESWWKKLAEVRKSPALMWLAINSESMTRKDVRAAVARFTKYRRVLVIFDESDDFGTPGSIRTKMARPLQRRCPFRMILSGTMVTASPLAAFSQFELLEKGALGFEKFEDFKARYAITETRNVGFRSFPKVVGFQNLDELRERMARFMSVVLREDCADMPALVLEERRIQPTEEQLRIYRELHRSFMVDIAENRVSVGERAPRLAKLQQVFSGFLIDEHKKRIIIPGANPRLDALSEELYLAPGKVIVWCQFQADMDLVRARALVDGHGVAEYHGRVSDEEKTNALRSFREDKGIGVFIAHARSGGRGQDFSVASSIIWYSHTFSSRLRQQAMERATKIGGKNIRVVDFLAPGPDEYIRNTTTNQINIADSLAGSGMRDFLRGIEL